jgi:hypothetical protein
MFVVKKKKVRAMVNSTLSPSSYKWRSTSEAYGGGDTPALRGHLDHGKQRILHGVSLASVTRYVHALGQWTCCALALLLVWQLFKH